jgi:acetylornithine/succinyldiaminopimelate/putrescine aminotransferase
MQTISFPSITCDAATLSRLWLAAECSATLDAAALPDDIARCVLHGDGVADHYGGRTAFTFLAQKDDRILMLERIDARRARAVSMINLTGGYGTGILGSALARVTGRLSSFCETAATTNDEFHSVERWRLVSTLKELIASHTASAPDDWDITFTSTGTEAMDLALQMAYLREPAQGAAPRDVIIGCHGAWHGWGLSANHFIDREHYTRGLPRMAGVRVAFMEYGSERSLRQIFAAHRGRIRAVLVEGLLGDGGIVDASPAWWRTLFELARAEQAVVIDDEILSGFRCGAALAIPPGLQPDCIALGKALGLGLFPISAVAWRKASLRLRPGLGVRTFNARPFQAAVVHAGLMEIAANDLLTRAETMGRRFVAHLRTTLSAHGAVFKAVRGRGMLIGLELGDGFAREGERIRNELVRHGVLAEIESGIIHPDVDLAGHVNETIRLTPPLTIDWDTLAEAARRIQRCAAHLAHGDPAARTAASA